VNILVEPNAHHLENMGDVAMLQIAVERLAERWPEATIRVLTDKPDVLRRFCPAAEPVPAAGRRIWFDESLVGHRLQQALPERFRGFIDAAQHQVRQRRPRAARNALQLKRKLKRLPTETLERFFDAIWTSDLLVVSGAGAITDPFAPLAVTILDLVELELDRGIPAVMMGQGIGPISDRRLRDRAASVLPRVNLIGVRERLQSLPLLEEFGMPKADLRVTGDDAVELALRMEPNSGGTAIGVNVRRARYSGLDDDTIAALTTVLKQEAARKGSRLVGLPISQYEKELDASQIGEIIGEPVSPPVDPLDVVRRVSDCGVVVTGSYHAAVFALAQGIPTVGLAASRYYEAKFEGLIDLFGTGCQWVDMTRADFPAELAKAMSEAEGLDDAARVALRSAAEHQVGESRAAYDAVQRLVGDRRSAPPR
jgi:polysaccharide pyruvyl transferase WcaK-like protein